MLKTSDPRSGVAPAEPADGSGIDAHEASAMAARVRRLMLISALTTALAIAAVLGVIGYRIFHAGKSAGGPGGTAGPGRMPREAIVTLPKGARIVSTATAGDRVVVTLDIGGATEIRTFDASTLAETGRLRFATEP